MYFQISNFPATEMSVVYACSSLEELSFRDFCCCIFLEKSNTLQTVHSAISVNKNVGITLTLKKQKCATLSL